MAIAAATLLHILIARTRKSASKKPAENVCRSLISPAPHSQRYQSPSATASPLQVGEKCLFLRLRSRFGNWHMYIGVCVCLAVRRARHVA